MAQLVEIIGTSHSPSPRLRDPNESQPGMLRARAGFGEMRQRLADARPDVLICIGPDHLNQLFMENMPAFMVGKAPTVTGPWTWEALLKIPSYTARVDVPLAKGIIRGGFDHGVDFAYSDELRIDHSFCIPLFYIRPEQDLPIVPILCNTMAPPIPPAKRFYQVGQALREIIEAYPAELRVGVLCSGHLSTEIGGPRHLNAIDPEFDRWSVELVGRGDVDAICRDLTFERLSRVGNYTSGFLTYVMLLGLAGGRPPTHYEAVIHDTGSMPFFRWDLYQEAPPSNTNGPVAEPVTPTRYQLDKAIKLLVQNEDHGPFERFMRDPQAYAQDFDLDEEERAALVGKDSVKMYAMGVQPFILQRFAAKTSGENPATFMPKYLEALKPFGHPNYET